MKPGLILAEFFIVIGIMTISIIEVTWPIWFFCLGYFILNYFKNKLKI